MFDIGGWELLVLAALALIIVGPKDLPSLVRNVGRWVAKARGLAREFQQGMEEAARDADIDDIRKAANLKTGLAQDVRKFGDHLKSAVEGDAAKPATTPAPARKLSEPTEPPNPVRHPDLEEDLQADEPTRPAPASPAQTARAASPADDDDDAFLENFQREVGYARRDQS